MHGVSADTIFVLRLWLEMDINKGGAGLFHSRHAVITRRRPWESFSVAVTLKNIFYLGFSLFFNNQHFFCFGLFYFLSQRV